MKKIVLFLSLSSAFLYAGIELDYLNSLRTKTGLPPFSSQANLKASSQNHSAYMQTNNISGHGEDSTKSGYTGGSPYDRVVYAGYFSRSVGENVSYGSSATYTSSIDGLFSAIYHRFGFLGLIYDEIGIGVSNNTQFYTYDLGNHRLNQLCQNPSYTGSDIAYFNVCVDTEKKIKGSDFTSASDTIQNASPALIVWPAVNSRDVPPVFYEESPDPLPEDSVTGYPVSVQFNEGKFTSAPTVTSFTLDDASGQPLNTLITMDSANDPNRHFSIYEFALFPEKRLEWGSQYSAEIIYTDNGVEKTKRWSFVTRSLQSKADKFYRIENNTDISLNVISGQTYAFYVVPHDTNDNLGGLSYNYTSNAPSFSYIDSNTFTIAISGSVGQYAQYTFNNGQKLKTIIATSDSATVPKNEILSPLDTDNDGIEDTVDLDDDNDGYSDVDEIRAGSNPKNVNSKPLDTDGDFIPNVTDTDDDNDGISDTDELSNGLNPLNTSDAQADFDKDGFSNAVEISVGSDIRNASSKPTWVPVMSGETVIFVPSFKANK